MAVTSLYPKLVRSCINSRSMSSIRGLREDMLLEDEVALHKFVLGYMSRHNVPPTEEACAAARFQLGAAAEPPSYYVERIRQRYAYNVLNEHNTAYVEAMRAQDVDAALEVLKTAVGRCGGVLSPTAFINLSEGARAVLADYEYARENPGLRGITMGWPKLDEATMGTQGGDLDLVVGTTGVGKTWVLMHMAYMAWRQGNSVCIGSMEMSKLPMMRRFVALHCRLNPNFIRSGELSTMGERRLMMAVDELSETGCSVNFMAGDMNKDVGTLVEMLDQFDPDKLFVDAAYLLTPEGRKNGYVSRWEKIADSVDQIKALALARDKSITASYQFNSNVRLKPAREGADGRGAGVPETGDIGGSKSAPQNASAVTSVRLGKPPFERIRRRLDLIKNREGESGIGFEINYRFTPIDFTEVIETDDTDTAHAAADMGWML